MAMSEMGMEAQWMCIPQVGTYTLIPVLGADLFDEVLAVGTREEDTWSART